MGAVRFVFILVIVPLALAQRSVRVDTELVKATTVLDLPTGKPGPLHEHKTDRVMIYLDAGHQRLRFEDGRVVDLKFQPGEVIWSVAGGMHTSENASGTPYRIVEIELKKAAGTFPLTPLDPLKVAPGNFKVVLNNDRVRVIKAQLKPRQKLPLHHHSAPHISVSLTNQEVLSSPESGAPVLMRAKAGDVQFWRRLKHAEENLSDQRMEIILVEFK